MNTAASSSTKSNFGTKGWLMIVFAGLMFYFYTGFCTDGLNVIVGNFAGVHGLDATQLLALTTPANWTGLIGSVLWAWFVNWKSTRTGALVTGVIGGISFLLYGVVPPAAGFFAVTALVNFMGMGFFTHTVANALMACWFPMKKGLALG